MLTGMSSSRNVQTMSFRRTSWRRCKNVLGHGALEDSLPVPDGAEHSHWLATWPEKLVQDPSAICQDHGRVCAFCEIVHSSSLSAFFPDAKFHVDQCFWKAASPNILSCDRWYLGG